MSARSSTHRVSIINEARQSSKDELIEALRQEVQTLRAGHAYFYASDNSTVPREKYEHMPEHGMPARHVQVSLLKMREERYENQVDSRVQCRCGGSRDTSWDASFLPSNTLLYSSYNFALL